MNSVAQILGGVQRFKSESSFDNVEAFLRRKKVFPYEVFDLLSDEQKRLAFSTALDFELDLMTAVNETLNDVIREGLDAAEFRVRLKKVLGAFGKKISGVKPHRVELLFRNATTNAANTGRYGMMFSPEGIEAQDGWLFRSKETACPRCTPMNGLVFRKTDSAAWAKLPMIHHRCSCIAISVRITSKMKVESGRDRSDVGGAEGFDSDQIAPLRRIFGTRLGTKRRAA